MLARLKTLRVYILEKLRGSLVEFVIFDKRFEVGSARDLGWTLRQLKNPKQGKEKEIQVKVA
jgi:hypothetical protein